MPTAGFWAPPRGPRQVDALDDFQFAAPPKRGHFTWGEFCDWYVELGRGCARGELDGTRGVGTSGCAAQAAASVLVQ
jgi:valyl-tRNA synthetase